MNEGIGPDQTVDPNGLDYESDNSDEIATTTSHGICTEGIWIGKGLLDLKQPNCQRMYKCLRPNKNKCVSGKKPDNFR